jgi:hypothetical protein
MSHLSHKDKRRGEDAYPIRPLRDSEEFRQWPAPSFHNGPRRAGSICENRV